MTDDRALFSGKKNRAPWGGIKKLTGPKTGLLDAKCDAPHHHPNCIAANVFSIFLLRSKIINENGEATVRKHSRTVIGVVAGFAMAIALGTAAHAKKITLRIGSGHPVKPVAYVTVMQNFFVPEVTKRVQARTKHKVKFIQGYAGTIAKVHQTLEAVQKGLLDIGGFCVCFEPTKAYFMNISYMVPFSSPDSMIHVKALRKLIGEHPKISSDFQKQYKQELLAITGFDNYGLGTNFAWKKFSDLKGHKILAAGPNLPWVTGSGAIPVTTTIPTAYNQLQSGVGEGIILFPGSYFGLKLHEAAPYYTITNFGGAAQVVLTMNTRTRAKLPKDVLAIVDEVGLEFESKATQVAMARHDPGLVKLKKAGTKVSSISPAAQAKWARSLEPFVNESAQKFTKRGLQGKKIFTRFMDLQEKMGHTYPYRYKIK